MPRHDDPHGSGLAGLDRDAEGFAEAIGLVRADPDEPGIVRRRHGRGVTYRWPDGTVVRGEHRDRCEGLVLPPAWRDVWICLDADGHLQATGVDDADRRQYRYHPRWTEARTAANFDRLGDVGRRLGRIRRAVEQDLAGADRDRRAVAAMIRLLDRSLERVGNPVSVDRFGTRGVSTLSPDNVDTTRRAIRLRFVGKGGIDHDVTVEDARLARAVADLEDAGHRWLFEVDGSVLDAADANAYLAEHSAGVVVAKDLRTWGGSVAALAERVRDDPSDPEVADAAAEALHNTRAVARSSYVHPVVFDAADDEVDEAWGRSRRSRWYARAERALARLLDQRPPLLSAHLRR